MCIFKTFPLYFYVESFNTSAEMSKFSLRISAKSKKIRFWFASLAKKVKTVS